MFDPVIVWAHALTVWEVIPALLVGLVGLALVPACGARDYARNVLLAINQLGATLVGGFHDETLGSYAYRMDQKGHIEGRLWRPVIDFLVSGKQYPYGYCEDAYQDALRRANVPRELR